MKEYVCLDLRPYVNNRGITSLEDCHNGALSQGGSSLPLEQLPETSPFVIDSVPFIWSKTERYDNIELAGQAITLEPMEVRGIHILGVSNNGNYFDRIAFLRNGAVVHRDFLFFSDFISPNAMFRERCALQMDYAHTRVGKYDAVQPKIWMDHLSFQKPCELDTICLEDNVAMHIFAITLLGQKRG